MTNPGLRGSPAPLIRLLDGRRTVALTGAGCSTESGIPDYRGPGGRLRGRTAMLYQEFVGDPRARSRYWARSSVGWPRFEAARPNPAHRALARLEDRGFLRGIITQNVDGLHQAAGSRAVVELHGSLARVRCLGCGALVGRSELQRRLEPVSPAPGPGSSRIAPDGDAELPADAERNFPVPGCTGCGGVLKPDVVFFGENVPRKRVERAWSLFEEAEVLLVVGSSLTVFSGRRFILHAEKVGLPVGILNLGPTRGDGAAAVKVEARAGEVLPLLVRSLGDGTVPGADPEAETRGVLTARASRGD